MRHYRVTFEDVIAAHDEALIIGGMPGVLNENLIRSAIGRPYSGYHRPIFCKAAALMHALVQNHGFTDGNKRTALLVTDLLIRRSKYRLYLSDEERIDDLVVDVAAGLVELDELIEWFKCHLFRV